MKKYVIGLLLLVAAFSAGRFSAPKSVTSTAESQVVSSENENVNRNTNTVEVVKETRMPDGTVVTERTKKKETSTQTERQRDSETNSSFSTTIESRPSFRVGLVYEPAIRSFQPEVYSAIIEKRLFSEIYAGLLIGSNRTVGVTLSLGF